MTFDEFTQYLGRFFFYGGVSAGLFWLVAQKTAERWVDAHFAKRQKVFEHEQAKELQRIKAKLDTVIQGSLKLQEREFKVIPEAWEKIGDAYGLACWLCAPMQSYTSLQRMSESHMEEFLSKQELLWETQKEQIRNTPAGSRDEVWQEIDTRMRYSKVHSALTAADKFLKVNSIFLPDDLREQLNKLVQVVWEALISFDIGNHHSNFKDYKMIREAWDKLKKDGEPLHAGIETAVRKRLLEQTQLADEKLQLAK
ncbi:MAG TPA: hypothetical protein VGK09_08045 [Rhodocyclaceae bacterium]|jgi:hypothetical protein